MTSSHYGGQPRPLPIRPRPVTGETTLSYIRRLARANHLRPNYLHRCLREAGHDGIRLDWLAIMADRPLTSLERALADTANPSQRFPARQNRRQKDKAALLANHPHRRLPTRPVHPRHLRPPRSGPQGCAPSTGLPGSATRQETPAPDIPARPVHSHDRRHPGARLQQAASVTPHREEHPGRAHHPARAARYLLLHAPRLRRSPSQPPQATAPPAPADTVGTTSAAPRAARRRPRMSWSPAHHAVEHEDLPRLRDSSTLVTTSRTTTGMAGLFCVTPSTSNTTATSKPVSLCTPTSPPSSSPAGPTHSDAAGGRDRSLRRSGRRTERVVPPVP
jgi:hypothetical protein